MNADEERRYIEYMKSDKWHEIARRRMEIDNFTCAGCGCRGTVTNVLEVHHLSYRYLYHEETRIYEDLVTLCHACHKNLHRIMERVTNEQGRRGWKHNPRIPATHIYNINGAIEILERKENQPR
jgi:5-methylcytosine-specific restriction endonuclease McrA